MTQLLTIPMEDDFETTLSTSWNGGTGSVAVNTTPAGTIPSGKYSYIVVDPGESNMQVAKIDGWNAGAKTFNVTSISVPRSQATNYSSVNHAAGAVVRFSNNLAFWEDIMTAIDSKADTTALNAKVGDFVFTGSKATTPAPMTFQDSETAAITLKELATGAPADQYVAVSPTDTTVGHLDSKLTAGDGLKKTTINPAGNESIDIDIDITDTTIFKKTSAGAADENKIPVLDAAGQLAIGFLKTGEFVSLIAGENISDGNAVRVGYPITQIANALGSDTNTQRSAIKYDNTGFESGQSFTLSKNETLTSIVVSLKKAGTPAGNLSCIVYSDKGITALGTSSNTVAENTLTTSYANYTFNFNNISVPYGTLYFKITSTRTVDSSNYVYRAYTDAGGSYTNGTGWAISSTNTRSEFGDKNFTINFTDDGLSKVYKTSALFPVLTEKFIGYANEAITAGNSGYICITGAKGGFTSKTPGAIQYLSDTAGAIAESAGTNSVKVGIALNATTVKIVNPAL